MPIAGFDHVSLPTADSERCIEFYKRLGFSIIDEDKWRNGESRLFAIQIGQSKINVHPPKVWQGGILRGPTALPGCGDLCFVWDGTVEEVLQLFEKNGLEVVAGPGPRKGGRGGGQTMATSVYTRDPDENLLEFMVYN